MIKKGKVKLEVAKFCLLSQLVTGDLYENKLDLEEKNNQENHNVISTFNSIGLNDSTNDILNNPAFRGFSNLILPWDKSEKNKNIPIRNIQQLLPYHSQVSPENIVKSLNRMIDDVKQYKKIFYDIYSDTQKKYEPNKKNTGLFFFRGIAGAPFAIICPGGGFEYVGSIHEGFPYATEINRLGYNVFVLRYRVGSGGLNAVQDLAAAISFIFRNANSLGVSTQHYSVWGSSAGARMAATIGSYGTAHYGGDNLPKPSAIIMAYTGHSDYSSHEPSTFVVVGSRDRIAPPILMEQRVDALQKNGTTVEYHKYNGVGHGFGLGKGTPAEGWIFHAVNFWEQTMNNDI
nr:alpha/beta hydrolase [uncultured Tolumonas sp.]